MIDLKKMRALRKEKKLTLLEVSRHLGFRTQQGYYYKERGMCKIKADELAKLADLYDVSVESLIITTTET